ncbi:HPP family protein [Pseudobdellovibrio exovorus]|uniref:CBS domain-containing protein n=1 Tax=Pseudobdellovibrio exovorus JSS TaxID=1184267 RepID=M4V8N8_9BACT|nr:CBS domain-containing protein [Pseudobdellovibrio exovorus]AGH94825.1 hypothetical protein A11Q_605 [Pseudobdellovibrio exovorus JSS]
MTFLTSAIMSSNLISISEEKSIAEAASLMKTHDIRHLPVVDSYNELSGIISVTDIAKARDTAESIKEIMTPRVRVVKKSANIKTIIDQMLKFKISSMLVAQNEDVVGIVTTDDLLQLLFELLDEEDDLKKLETEGFLDEGWDDDPSYNYPLRPGHIN